jgi:UDP-N-acetylglucosamine acyltransferase
MINIHPTAIVSKKAELADGVSVGAHTIIHDDVVIGENTEIRSSVVIGDGARIGKDNAIYHGAVIATEPQDLKYNNEKTYVIIGDRNVIREYATVNRATVATGKTTLGSDCLLMAYVHLAHDCHVGDNVIIANATGLAGHVTIEDFVTVGGVVKLHQFITVGCHSMIGADVKLVKDVPPYTLIGNNPAKVDKLNIIGLRRRGFDNSVIREIDKFYRTILWSKYNVSDGVKKYIEENEIIPEIQHCIDFIKKSERGIYR